MTLIAPHSRLKGIPKFGFIREISKAHLNSYLVSLIIKRLGTLCKNSLSTMNKPSS